MTAIQQDTAGGSAGSGSAAALDTADRLCLAAAPSFAVMAILTSLAGSGRPHLLCAAMQDASPLSGMVAMYLLMSAFHLAPWLRLFARRRSRARRSRPGVCGVSS